MSDFKIGWMFPDTLFLHGERGNLLALARFAQLSGLDPEIERIDFDTESFDPEDYDILFFAPGEISAFPVVLDWLAPYREALTDYVTEGHPLIVTGTSVGLFCDRVIRDDGSDFPGLGIIYTEFRENHDVYGDDVWFTCEYNGEQMEIIGNQIQMGDLIINDEKAFGDLIYGYGNTGKDEYEGVLKWNSIFTNTLGPMLVCNPWLTVKVIQAAADASGKKITEVGYDMDLEKKSFETKKDFIKTKETHLTNCKR